jgi:hypothetical protein
VEERNRPILWRLGSLTGDKPVDREQGVAGILIIHLLPPLRNRQDAYSEIKEWLTFCGPHPPLCLETPYGLGSLYALDVLGKVKAKTGLTSYPFP